MPDNPTQEKFTYSSHFQTCISSILADKVPAKATMSN